MSGPFRGALGQYRKPRTIGIIQGATIEGRVEAARTWVAEDIEKLKQLSVHFGTTPGNHVALCIKLADIGVPALQEKARRGRPTKWTHEVTGVLIVEIERKVVPDNKSKGVAWAAKQLLLNPLWDAFIARREGDGTSADPSEVLRKIYTDNRMDSEVGEYRTIKDGDFYDFKPKPLSNWDLKNVLDEVHWQSERQRKYFYKLTLRPGKELRLLFPEPKTAAFYPEITIVLGRETKWSDAVATMSGSDKVKPEARDPLE